MKIIIFVLIYRNEASSVLSPVCLLALKGPAVTLPGFSELLVGNRQQC